MFDQKFTSLTKDDIGDIPKWGLFSHFDIFKQCSVTTQSLEFNGKKYVLPHFPLDTQLSLEHTQEQLDRTVNTIKQRVAILLEVAYVLCMSTGEVYAPSKTVSYNWYKESGKYPVEFESTEPKIVDRNWDERNSPHKFTIESLIEYYESLGYQGKIYGFASPEAFEKLKNEGFSKVESESDLSRYQKLSNGKIDIYNYRGTYIDPKGEMKRHIEAGHCIFFPQEEAIASIHYGPSNTFPTVGIDGVPLYVSMYNHIPEDGSEGRTEVMSETNFLCILEKPEYVVHIQY